MGNRLSGTLAILAMDRFERMFIYQELNPQLIIYVRFVDDIGTVVSNIDQAYRILNYINSKHPTLKFELELPGNDGYLPILDIQITIDETGNIHYKLFTKKASKQITLHYESHQPTRTKRAMVKNEFERSARCSSSQHRSHAIATTRTKLNTDTNRTHFSSSTSPS